MSANVNADPFGYAKPWEVRLIAALLFTTVMFALLPSGLSWENIEASADVVEGSMAVKLQWGGIFAVSGFIVMRHRALALSNLRAANPFLLAIFAYCLLSTLWSPAAGVTVKKVIQFGGMIALSLAIQTDRKPWTHSILVMLAALTSIEFASAVVAIVNPSFGIDAYFGYAWRGVLAGKNTLGAVGALSVLVWASVWQLETLRRGVFWFGLLLSLLCVIMSKSSTSITITALGLASLWVFRKQHIGSPLWLQRLLVSLGIAVIVLTHIFYIHEGRFPEREEVLEPFASLFGKTADLTGRADIWEPLMVQIEKHWLYGIGYGAFWLGYGSPAQPILDVLPWVPFQAHNGYLDLLNELGVVGVALFVGILISNAYSLSILMRVDRPAAALFASLLITTLFSNLTETSMFRGVTFPFILMILSFISATSDLNHRRLVQLMSAAPSGLVTTPGRDERANLSRVVV